MWAWEGGDLRKDPILGARAALDRLQGLLSLPAPSADVAGGAPEQAGGARRLKQALRPQTDSAAFWRAQLRAHLISTAGALVQYGGVLSAVASVMSPQGPGCCDHNGRERAANLLTSLPYAWIGVHGLRTRTTHHGRAWSASMLGVAAGSVAFHSTSGCWRLLGRKADYWAIAASSSLLTRALYPNQSGALTAACLLVTPFKPFLVSAVNTLAMETAFLRRALRDPALRPAQRLHSAAALAGVTLFFAEDARPHAPFIHSAWHLCSASATSAVHALLADTEARLNKTAGGGYTLDGGGWALDSPKAAARDGGWDFCGERAVAVAAASAAAAAAARELAVSPLLLELPN